MKSSRNGRRPKSRPKGRRVELSADELQLVLNACMKYRHSIPVYLASCQSELRLIRSVIRKLS